VDNEGKLIADAGTILAQAQTVNNNGLMQANSVQNVNGVIELVASDNVSLGRARILKPTATTPALARVPAALWCCTLAHLRRHAKLTDQRRRRHGSGRRTG